MSASFLESFRCAVAQFAGKKALVCGPQSVTYAELEVASNRIGGALRARGIGQGEIVPLLLPRSVEAVAAMLGVWKAGAALTIVSTEYPRERARYIRNLCDARVMIDRAWLETASDSPVDLDLPGPASPDETGLVVFTSGSTGNPKGVVIPHRAISLAVRGNAQPCDESDAFLSIASFSFIVVMLDIFAPLSLGATAHIAPDEMRRDLARIAEYIEANRITAAFLPPQMASQYLAQADGRLRVLFTGSERVSRTYGAKTRLICRYGASETCGPMTDFEVDKPYENTPIGRPYEGSRVYLLDDDGREVPPGREGEICVCGQVATGYLKQPEATAASFVPNPFATGPDDTVLFRTNDIGRLLPSGELEYVQRKDWMLKVRGYRVEPGEIEAVMMREAPVERAVVTGFEGAGGGTRLYACYTAKERVEPAAVLRAIEKFLPDYMMPSFIEQIDTFPLNANGKIDRKSIAPPDAERYKADYEPPRDDDERALCEAFERVLGVRGAGALDDFALLGGDSISAVKLQTLLPETSLSVADILTKRTPRALAEAARSSGGAQRIEHAGAREYWPLSFAERQMAAEQGLDPESVAYNVNLAFSLSGKLDEQRLEDALKALVGRHRILRSYYPAEKGEYTHRIARDVPVVLGRETCVPGEINARIAAKNTPYDIARAPLFRFTLFETGPDERVLHLGLHHIIVDGVSGGVLTSDLWNLYEGKAAEKTDEPDYFDYAVRCDEREAAGEGAEEKKFFMDMFADGVPENEMPTRPTRPERLPFADTDCERTLDAATVDAAARRMGVTPYALLVSAAALVLAKFCGSEDVVLGTAMNGRNVPGTGEMIGMFVNTLPVRVKPEGSLAADDYVARVAALLRDVQRNQTCPFESLVPSLAPDRNPSRSPVFDLIVNYLDELPSPEIRGLKVERLPIKSQALAIDLMLEMTRAGGEIRAVSSYSPELYHDEVVSEMADLFSAVVERLASGKRMTLCDAAELTEEQRNRLLVDFAGPKSDEYRGHTVVELFREQAKRTPDRKAVVFGETSLSYVALDTLTDRLAAELADRGIGRERTVGILVRRSERMVVCALGALKSGAAYVPLDPGYPADRLEFMVEDAGASLVIADDDLTALLPGYGGEFLSAEAWSGIGGGRTHGSAPTENPRPEDTLVLLYTSGTTGKPKGVMLTHGNLANFCAWFHAFYGLTEADNVAAYASFGFDACLMDLYPALTRGACVHVIPEEMRLDLPHLAKYFDEKGVTVAFMTTQLGRQFAESMPNKSLRALSVGGETLVPLEPPASYQLYNGYGPTECTIFSNIFPVEKRYDRVPLGKPLANTALYVVDKHDRLAPVGTGGELCIAGRQVAKGYLNRPDLTEEKFVPNPFSDDPDYARMYRTGDVARWLPTGDIDFIGRRDFQVKIRGFRVELGEIEGRIRAYPGVTDAAVVARDAAGGGKCAVAYIVANEPVDVEALNRFIEDELPSYMVPAAVMQLERIPLNPNGKVDRRKLPEPVYASRERVEGEAVPATELGAAIADIITEILGHDQFGPRTNLLRAGLTSLSAIKLAAKLDERFGVAPAVREMMKDPTPIGLENAIVRILLRAPEKRQPESKQAPAPQSAYPLSQSQAGVCFDCMKHPDSIAYNIPLRLSLPPAIDAAKLASAVAAVIDAHPVVKSHLETEGEAIVQVPDETPAAVPCGEATEEELAALSKDFARPFALFEGPLYRARVVRTPERVALLVDFHHIVFDGASLDLFLREIGAAYEGRELARERTSGFECALAEAKNEGSESWLADKAYFDAQLANCEGASELPADLSGTPHTEATGAMGEVVRHVDERATENFCRLHGITPAGLFLAASAYALTRWLQSPDVYLSTISSGRSDPRLRNSFGMFVRTLPLAVKMDGKDREQTALAFVRAAQEALSEAVAHEGYPFTHVAQAHGFEPAIMYACDLGVIGDYCLGGERLRMEPLAPEVPKFKLSIHAEERDGKPAFAVQYDDARYSRALMERFAETLATALGNIVAMPDTPIRKISLVSKEAKALLAKWGETDDEQTEFVLHRIFERIARENPDKLAMIAQEGEYTYAQLDAEANRVANALLARGVRREDRVAFVLRRTGRVLIAMLGVLKAGCAYIPVDPEYPQERIEHVLGDSGARFLLSTADLAEKTAGIANVLDIDEIREGQSAENPEVAVDPGQLAYLIYTSGSTGKPKGVMIEHRSIANYVTPHPLNRQIWGMKEYAHATMSITTVAFDMFLKEGMGSLCNGLTLVFADDETARDPIRLAELFARTGADAFNTTPSRMLEYMEYPALLEAVRRCKVVMAGAEKYPEALVTRLRVGCGVNAHLYNGYGPTEITITCNAKELAPGGRLTIGGPLLGVHEYVVDADGNELPPGIVGELWIGGRGVARGYINLPQQTAERFVIFNGERVYKSGDFARWTPEGEIEILGRNDSQIKLRGLRIELGEIENAIMAIPGVKTCAVAIRNLGGTDHLCAWYAAEGPVEPKEMRETLGRTLTPYMVPTAYLQIEAMPKTPNGKNDLRALPDAILLRVHEYEAPKTPLEETFCEIFSKVLGLDRVGANDSFFEIGGSSLAVTRVIIEAKERGVRGEGGTSVAYGDVFAHPTPRELAALLAGGGAVELPPEPEADYDYTAIHALLARGTLEAFRAGERRPLGDVLLTGATGFLGVHVLRALLQSEAGAVRCLLRRGRYDSVEARLKNILYYYFEDSFEELAGSRLFAVEGDITQPETLERLAQYPTGTVINCAANVTHFAKDTGIADVNTGGVVNLANFALARHARLIQISTASVAGVSVDGKPPRDAKLGETTLYFGQNLENQYINSKFLAERALLEMVPQGLDAKIMRVGNLMARNRDGEFQINARANSFMGRLRAYQAIGCFPYSAYLHTTELAPIDSTAAAILLLAGAPPECRVFHPYNNHTLYMGDIIMAMRDEGIEIEMAEDDAFQRALSEAMKDKSKAERLTSLIAYQNVAQGRAAVPVASDCNYTTQALLRMDWRWPETSSDYLHKFLRGMIDLGFFGEFGMPDTPEE